MSLLQGGGRDTVTASLQAEKGSALASHWHRPGRTCCFSTFSSLLPTNTPDASSIALRQNESD